MTKPFSYEEAIAPAAPSTPTPFSYEEAKGEKPKDATLGERVGFGFKRALSATQTALTDDPTKIAKQVAQTAADAPRQSAAAAQMQADIKPYVEAANKAEGVVDTVKGYGILAAKRAGQLISNPGEAGKMIAEQLPNSLPGMAGGIAGAKGGAALGSVFGPMGTAAGAVIGGVAGGLAGGYLTEKGSSIQEQVQKKAQEAGVNIQDQGAVSELVRNNQTEIDNSAALKGLGTAGTDAVLNVLTVGLSGMGRRMLGKEIGALAGAVKAGQVTATDAAKQLAALEAKAVAQGSWKQVLGRGAAVTTAEMLGEGGSEAVGQKLAYGSVDAGEVVDESLLGLGQGVGMAAASGAYNKLAGTPDQNTNLQRIETLRNAIGTPTAGEDTGTGAPPPAGAQPPAPFVNPASLTGNNAAALLGGQGSGLTGAADPLRAAIKPSEAMGIDPNAGVLSRTAAEAVDGPASMEMAVRQAERDMAALAAEDNPEAGADAAATTSDPLVAQVAGYVAEMGTASPQMVAAKFGVTIPRATELLAQADPAVDDLFPPPQGAANVSNTDAAGAMAAGVGGAVGADAAGSGPDAGLLAPAAGSSAAGDSAAPGPAVQEGDAAPVPGRDSDKALTKGPTQTKAKVGGLKELIARNKAAKSNVQNQPQVATPAAAPAPAQAVQAPQAVGGDGAAQPGAAPAGNPGVEAAGVVPASTDATGKPASWMIRNKDTGEVVMETFDRAKVQALNTAKYEAVPAQEYLAGLSKKSPTPSPTTTEPTNGTQTSEAIPQETGREETALLSDSVKPASKYQLPQGRVSDSWFDAKKRGTDHPDYEPTPRQQMLMDEVAKAKDAGAFYANDVKDAVAKALGVDAETLAANTTGVEGGDFGYDVYLAGRAVDAKRKNASEKEIAKELSLKPGDKLGTLVFNDMKVTNSVEVESVSDDGLSFNFKGKRGPVGVKFSTGPVNVKGAIERAHEKGKRKDTYGQFIEARKAPAAPAVAAPAPSQQAQAPAEPQETTHNGTRIYRTRAKLGDEVKTMWAVETPENKARRAAGERALGGDTLHDTIEQAKTAADREAKEFADRKAFAEQQDAGERARKEADEARKAANRGKSIAERRKETVLDGQTKLPASAGLGNTTRRNAMQMAVDQGRAVVERQVDDTAAKKRDQDAIERVRRAGYMLGLSNENIPVVKAGLEAQARLKANDYKKPEYRVYAGSEPTGGFFEITKIEYEYAQELMAQKAAAPAAAPAVQPTVAQATHQDPGEKPEAATKGVVNDSLKTAAKNEDTKPSEMRKWLLAEIDKELLQAPDRADYDEAVKRMGEKDAISMYTGNGFLGKNTETGFITFDVPGDGKFKVRNSVRGLLEFRKTVNSSLGFKDGGQKTLKPEQNDGVQGGSGGQMAAVTNMIEEGDFEAARDYAEAVGIKLEDVKVPRGERKPQWDQFLKDGTVPQPPNTAPLPEKKTADQLNADQLNAEKLEAEEAERRRPKDTGWNMAGTGYGGKRYTGRNITLADGREVVARIYENAGNYDEVEVKVDGARKFTARDTYNAQDKADAFIRTLTSTGGDAALPAAEPKARPAARVTPQISGNPEKFIKVAADSVRELRSVDVDRVLTETPVQFRAEVAGYIKDRRQDLADEVDDVMADLQPRVDAPAVQPVIPEGFKPAGEPFYRDGELIQGYAPFDLGQRVTMKESGGQSGVIDLFTSPDKNGVFDGAMVKFDNGVEQIVKLNKLEAEAAPAATGTRRDPTKVSMFNPYNDGDIVTIDGQDWTVKADTPGWYLTTTGNWRGQHPTIRNVKAMADLIREVEQAAEAKPASAGRTYQSAYDAEVERMHELADKKGVPASGINDDLSASLASLTIGRGFNQSPDEFLSANPAQKGRRDAMVAWRNGQIDHKPGQSEWAKRREKAQPAAESETQKLTQAEAKDLMEWQDLGQKDGIKTHILTFYESKANKDANRGRMVVATVTKEADSKNWVVDGTDDRLAMLAMAKKKAEDAGMARAVADGFVEPAAAAPEAPKKGLAGARAKKAAEAEAQRVAYFTPGNIVKGYGGHDRVLEYTPVDERGTWSVRVQAVVKQGEQWVDAPRERPRWHSTQPEAKELAAGPLVKVPAVEHMAKYDTEARAYGYQVATDGKISKGDKALSPVVKEVRGRLRVEAPDGKLLFSGATTPEAFGEFLRSFWGAEKAATGDTPMFSRAKAKEIRNLVTLHNMTEANLEYSDSLGGMPVPSLGITKVDAPFSGFGNITLIGDKNLVDPEQGVPVFDRDAWTARFPTMNFKKPKKAKADAFYERMKAMTNGFGVDESNFLSNLWDSMVNASVTNPDKVADHLRRYDAPRMAYARDVLGRAIKVPMRDARLSSPAASDKQLQAYWKKNGKRLVELERELSGFDFGSTPEYKAFMSEIEGAIRRYADSVGNAHRADGYVDKFLPGGELGSGGFYRLSKDFEQVGKKEVDGIKLREAVDKVVKPNDPAYLRWVQEQVKPLFEAPTITLRGKEVEPTLDNIVEAMTTGAVQGVEKSMTFGPGKLAAHLGKRFKSLAEIKAARDQVVSESAESEAKKATDALLDEFRTHVAQFFTFKDWRGNIDTWAANDASMEALARAGKQGLTDANIRLALARKDFKGVDQRGVDLARQAIEALRDTATNYFEAKPQRAVKISEFKGAVVPKDISPDSLAILEKNGITVEFYGKADGAREKAIEKLAKRLDRQSGDVVFSRAAAAGSMPIQTAQQIVDTIKARWKNAPEVIVLADMNDPRVPEAVRKGDAEQRSGGATGEPEGFYYKGTAYVVAGSLKTPGDVVRVLLHESLGHHGLRGVFGDGLKTILKQIANMRKSEVQAKAIEYGLDMGKESDRLQAAEEVLAVMAQSNPQAGFVKRAIGAIRAWLRENIPGLDSMRLTDNDIVTQFILPARRFVQQGPAARVGDGVLAMSRSAGDVTDTPAFRKWFGDSKVVDADGKPLVVSRSALVAAREAASLEGRVNGGASDAKPIADLLISQPFSLEGLSGLEVPAQRKVLDGVLALGDDLKILGSIVELVPVDVVNILARKNLSPETLFRDKAMLKQLLSADSDGSVATAIDVADALVLAVARMAAKWSSIAPNPFVGSQKVGSAARTGDADVLHGGIVNQTIGNNGQFDPQNPDIRFRSTPRELAGMATDQLKMTLTAPGKLSWWHKTVGTMYNLAERYPAFKPVFNAAQSFIDDVSYYATDAADLAPKMLPKLESWKDIAKSPISAEDNKAIEAPINEGTLLWARDESGRPVKVAELEAQAADMTADQKARRLLRNDKISEGVLRMWQGLPQEQYEKLIESRYQSQMLAPGLVWTDAELKAIWKLNDSQIGLYREVRAAIDKSLDNLAKSDLVRFVGKDGVGIKDAIMEAGSVDEAALMARDYFIGLAEAEPDRAEMLLATANGIMDRADKVTRLKEQGYAPLSRFGKYTVDVVTEEGRQYFGLFESMREANQMAARMRGEFGKDAVSQGTLSDESFKLFQGITPETLELFGNMLGLSDTGDTPQDQAFQAYLKLTKNNRSAMKRLIQRKGILGYSQDVGRVLANFIYSNARQTAGALHIGDLTEAVNAIPQSQGELKDEAVRLAEYIQNPQEEAQAFRGLLFAQYLGGSIASAMVNMTQPLQVSLPYLSQFGGVGAAGKELMRAIKGIATGKKDYEPDLARALKHAEEDGTVSPQEVHQLMAQARGAGTLRSGDGTKLGDALAKGGNAWAKMSLAWGKVFGVAEQMNRRSTFIAAYRLAKAQKMADPAGFAKKAVHETQFIYSKANKMRWGRGAIGGVAMTFKSYSVSYLELLHRMATQGGPEGKRAAMLAVAVLLVMGGAGGLPFMEDAEDITDAIAQVMGYNFSTKQAKQELLQDLFGEAAGQFIERGVSGLPGVPLDVTGRLGMGNLIPGTGMFLQKNSNTRDVLEIAGPAGDLAQRVMNAGGMAVRGNLAGAALELSPKAIRDLAKGADMANTGMYRDAKGFKVIDTTAGEAGLKAIGFQPNTVAKVQEANYLMQRQKDFYNVTAQNIRAKWARGLFEQDEGMVAEAREAIDAWNEKNPDQRMSPNMPAIWRRVREMAKDKDQRIADTAPKAMRQQFREETARVREAL